MTDLLTPYQTEQDPRPYSRTSWAIPGAKLKKEKGPFFLIQGKKKSGASSLNCFKKKKITILELLYIEFIDAFTFSSYSRYYELSPLWPLALI